MTYAFYYDAPGSPAMYEQVRQRIGAAPVDGLVLQLVTQVDGGLRHLNVWRSHEDWDAFRSGRVEPAVREVLAAAGIPVGDLTPTEHELVVVDLQCAGEVGPAAVQAV